MLYVVHVSVTVSLSPIGNAPVLKQKKFTVARERTIGWMNQWLRKNLKCDSAESVVKSLHHVTCYYSHMTCFFSCSLCTSSSPSPLHWIQTWGRFTM